ncbi:MAG: hypothetical protein ACK5MU_00675 [Candidatus Saccharimonadales bacterium]
MHDNEHVGVSRGGKVDPLIFVLVIMVVASIAVILLQSRSTLERISGMRDTRAVEMSAEEIKEKVGRWVELPDEYSLLATVDNAKNLSVKESFKDVADGDRVLIFPQSRFVVVYRAGEDRIIYSGRVD